MSSGHGIHSKIESLTRQVDGVASEVARKVDTLRGEQARLRQMVSSQLLAMARVHAAALDADEMAAYDALTREIDDGLSKRKFVGKSRAVSAARASAELEKIQDQESTVAREVDAATEELRGIERQVDNQLSQDAGYQALQIAASAAAERHALAVRKAEAAVQERQDKQVSYERDPLFMYLWRFNFGIDTYRASNVVKAIDGWVAGLCNFAEAARNYQALMALPSHLEERARAKEIAHQEAQGSLDENRRAALIAAGAAPLEDRLKDLRDSLDRIRVRRRACEDDDQEARTALLQFENWEDDDARAILTELKGALGTELLARLRERVSRTASSEDDTALEQIESLMGDLRRADRALEEAQQESEQAAERLLQVRKLRSRYRDKGYNSSDYRFGSATDRGLDAFMAGKLSADECWAALQDDADYDPPRSTSSSSGGGFGGGSFGGGSFKTGGGFGGGGFKTGGGF